MTGNIDSTTRRPSDFDGRYKSENSNFDEEHPPYEENPPKGRDDDPNKLDFNEETLNEFLTDPHVYETNEKRPTDPNKPISGNRDDLPENAETGLISIRDICNHNIPILRKKIDSIDEKIKNLEAKKKIIGRKGGCDGAFKAVRKNLQLFDGGLTGREE